MQLYLAFITLDVKAPIERHNTNSFLLARLWHDGIVANGAAWSEFPKYKNQLDKMHWTNNDGNEYHLWKSSMQWMRLAASTVNGMPSRQRWQTMQVKH